MDGEGGEIGQKTCSDGDAGVMHDEWIEVSEPTFRGKSAMLHEVHHVIWRGCMHGGAKEWRGLHFFEIYLNDG